jgi:hypothetical protein
VSTKKVEKKRLKKEKSEELEADIKLLEKEIYELTKEKDSLNNEYKQ